MSERIKELYISSGILDCLRDPYDSLNNGDNCSSIEVDLQRFAELIIQESEWVGLSEDDILSCAEWPATTWSRWLKFARNIEASLKEKNHGEKSWRMKNE
jgi:hypothetical protein